VHFRIGKLREEEEEQEEEDELEDYTPIEHKGLNRENLHIFTVQ